MKAEDLMVGDWVLLFDDKIAKVDCIGNTEVYLSDETGLDWQVTYEHIRPIFLTPEILELNGFENVSVITVGTAKMRWVSEDTRTEITIWMDDTLPMEIVKNVYYEDEVSYTLPFPGTVHLLQHVIRLCGVNKEIVL